MSEKLEPLFPENIYHVYNQSIGNEDIFKTESDYLEFLIKLKKYILPVCDIFSYALMPNHYHLLIRTKTQDKLENEFCKNQNTRTLLPEEEISIRLSRRFSDFFNAYAKYYNYTYGRRGALFRRAFRRKKVESKDYFKILVCYIHRNPVEAGLVKACGQWKFSSYNSLISKKGTVLDRSEVIEMFDDVENFVYCCHRKINAQLDL